MSDDAHVTREASAALLLRCDLASRIAAEEPNPTIRGAAQAYLAGIAFAMSWVHGEQLDPVRRIRAFIIACKLGPLGPAPKGDLQ